MPKCVLYSYEVSNLFQFTWHEWSENFFNIGSIKFTELQGTVYCIKLCTNYQFSAGNDQREFKYEMNMKGTVPLDFRTAGFSSPVDPNLRDYR
jgi:hypothetical protein